MTERDDDAQRAYYHDDMPLRWLGSSGASTRPRDGAGAYPRLPAASAASEESGAGYGLTAIGPVLSERKARDWALVLQSGKLWHMVHATRAGWFLLVRDEDYQRAASSIDGYESENRDWPPRPQRERLRHASSPVPALIFAALAFFFLATGPVAAGSHWFRRGTAVTDLLLTAEPWRAVTALTLHADGTHVLGNVISGTIFASAVQRRLGTGGAALAMVASGTVGNLANALWHHGLGQAHRSIGASTAVFGAVGLLAATQLVLDRVHASGEKRRWYQVVAPVVGGLALLGALGASPRADLGAHLFGLLAGLLIGLVAGLTLRGRPSASTRRWLQPALAAAAAVIVLGAWALALRGAPFFS